MISGTPARPTKGIATAAARPQPVDIEAELDRQIELMIKGIMDQLMEGQDGISPIEARMDAMVLLTVTVQSQAEEGDEGDAFLLWLLEEKQKRELS